MRSHYRSSSLICLKPIERNIAAGSSLTVSHGQQLGILIG
jgi:hypothetical protein